MEQKTKVHAEDGRQEIIITREFDLPLELLFKAYEEPELFEQWMGTKVLKMENKKHGSYAFETSHDGNVVFRANGTIHEFVSNQRITRTFEMENTPFPVQIEYLSVKTNPWKKITNGCTHVIPFGEKTSYSSMGLKNIVRCCFIKVLY